MQTSRRQGSVTGIIEAGPGGRGAGAGGVAGRRASYPCLVLLWVASLFAAGPVLAVDDAELLTLLRGGGHTLYFRHVATDWSNDDRLERAGDWLSCDPAEMRQLSDSGRTDARRIGLAIRALGIPVGEILASPYCRTMETARLFGLGPVEPSTAVMNLRAAAYFGGRDSIVADARDLLSTPPAAGANRVVVAHGNVAREATPVYPGEGEGVVFRVNPAGGFDVIARIPPARWQRILESEGGTQGERVSR